MEARQSMLDVVKNGLLLSGRTTYLHRMLYVGAHASGFGLEEHMKNLVSAQAEQPRNEPLSGFLLVYQSHFVHLVEGSESALSRHLQSVVEPNSEGVLQIEKIKIIFEVAHINKRCLTSWSSRSATPPSLAEPLGAGDSAPAAEVARHVDTVLAKTLRLVDALKKLPPGSALSQQLMLQLPQTEPIQLLLASPLLLDGHDLIREQQTPPRIVLYDDVVWPMPSDFVPYNLFEQATGMQVQTDAADATHGGEDDQEEQAGSIASSRTDDPILSVAASN